MKKSLLYLLVYFISFGIHSAEQKEQIYTKKICINNLCGICKKPGADANIYWCCKYSHHAHKQCYDLFSWADDIFCEYLKKKGIEDKDGLYAELHIEALWLFEKELFPLLEKTSFYDFYRHFGGDYYEAFFIGYLKKALIARQGCSCIIS